MAIRRKRGSAALLVALGLAASAAGCDGGSAEGEESGRSRSLPRSLARAESAAEDTIELVLEGRRNEAVRTAATLDNLANGGLEKDLGRIATKEELGEFQARAAKVAGLAPEGEPIAVALAANRAFELIARFYGRYDTDVPGDVLQLDHLEFEAKLRALAQELDPLRAAVEQLSKTWAEVSKRLPSGDEASAARQRFDGHVATMGALVAAGTDFGVMASEAERGLDLVDELEGVFAG